MKEDIYWELRTDKLREQLKQGLRQDGRKFNEYRKINIITNFSKNAHGSARVRVGETDVICGVRMELGEPYPDSPDQGTISVGAEFVPMASPVFEVGPPDENAIELARVVDRGIREGKALDFKKLCIVEGEQVWIVFIDLYIANHEGNLFDAASLAAMSALLDTRVPKVEDGKLVKGEFTGRLDVESKPLLCTFAKIDNTILLDPSLAEEKAAQARFSVATVDEQYMSAMQKGEAGTFTLEELEQCIDQAFKSGKQLRKLLPK
jgi:exosome complex component RRP42